MQPRPEYPRPRLRRREWVNLNGEWEFGAGDRKTTFRASKRTDPAPGFSNLEPATILLQVGANDEGI